MNTSFSDRLKIASKWAGLGDSQADLCRALGLSRQTVNRWFLGGGPSVDLMRRLAEVLGVDRTWLETGQGDMRPKPADETPTDEVELLRDYRSASAPARQHIRTIARALRKAVVTIAALIPPLLAPNDADAALLHKSNCDAQNAGVIHIVGNWIMSWLRSCRVAPVAAFA